MDVLPEFLKLDRRVDGEVDLSFIDDTCVKNVFGDVMPDSSGDSSIGCGVTNPDAGVLHPLQEPCTSGSRFLDLLPWRLLGSGCISISASAVTIHSSLMPPDCEDSR